MFDINLQIPIREDGKIIIINLNNIKESIIKILNNKELNTKLLNNFNAINQIRPYYPNKSNEFEITLSEDDRMFQGYTMKKSTLINKLVIHRLFVLMNNDLISLDDERSIINVEFRNLENYLDFEQKLTYIIFDDVKYNIYKIYTTWKLLHGEDAQWSLYNNKVIMTYDDRALGIRISNERKEK